MHKVGVLRWDWTLNIFLAPTQILLPSQRSLSLCPTSLCLWVCAWGIKLLQLHSPKITTLGLGGTNGWWVPLPLVTDGGKRVADGP